MSVTNVSNRLSISEYGEPVDINRDIATIIGGDISQANSLLIEAGKRVASHLGIKNSLISVSAKGVIAYKFAGLIRISPTIELEVAPKFLGNNSVTNWQEDFYFLSTLSKYGRLLPYDKLSSSSQNTRDLPTLLAMSFASMYESNKRRPLRSYRKNIEANFSIIGNLDSIDVLAPSSDGFRQEVIHFDRYNNWNAHIVAAAKALLSEIQDPVVTNALLRLINELSPQGKPINRHSPMPARYKAWEPLYKLSIDILSGFGFSYQQGFGATSGYVVSTWQIWEDLLRIATTSIFGGDAVRSQSVFKLGLRFKADNLNGNQMNVKPDLIINAIGSTPRFILDAKYKGNVEKGALRISEADIYESIAFSIASNCETIVLAYPAQAEGEILPLGNCKVFEEVIIDNIRIVGVNIEIRGISKKGALGLFSESIHKNLCLIVRNNDRLKPRTF